jgi:hypothetical protein
MKPEVVALQLETFRKEAPHVFAGWNKEGEFVFSEPTPELEAQWKRQFREMLGRK